MTFQRELLQLYFIMGSNNTSKDPVQVLKKAIEGGVTCFQFREKGPGAKTGTDKFALGQQFRDVCREHQIPFVVNDDVDLAVKLEADGIHIGQDDASIEDVREKVPHNCFIGVSASTIEESFEAEKRGADYVGVGPIYKTTTKADALEPIGVSGLQSIRDATSIPIVAISGISEATAGSVFEYGADGIAVISAISQAQDPLAAAQALSNIAKQYDR